MPKINEYPLQESLTGDELFVVETDDGTKKLSSETILAANIKLNDELDKLWLATGTVKHPRAYVYNAGTATAGTCSLTLTIDSETQVVSITASTGSDVPIGYTQSEQLQLSGTDLLLLSVAYSASGSCKLRVYYIGKNGGRTLIRSYDITDGSSIDDNIGDFLTTDYDDIIFEFSDN